MKQRVWSVMLGLCLAGTAAVAAAEREPEVSDLELAGEIEGENITFTLTCRVDPRARNVTVPLVEGDVAYLDGDVPGGTELVRHGRGYALRFAGGGGFGLGFSRSREAAVRLRFASRPARDGDWRHTRFAIPMASVRKLAVRCDRDDLEVQFPGALKVQRATTPDGATEVTAYLGIADAFEVRWKPQIKRLAAELVVACEANTIATASVGALRLDTVFTYRVVQGELTRLSLRLPDVNVTQVRGEYIQDWRIDRTDPGAPRLAVTLSRPREAVYRMRVESELILPKLPCSFDLPVLAPENVIRTSGFLLVGADSAINLQVGKAGGLTQIDQASFPAVGLGADRGEPERAVPARRAFAYQYASTPYTLALDAEDIVTSYAADHRLVLALEDNELAFTASVEIDVKDAPAREIAIATDPEGEWTVTGVTGRQVAEADTDVRVEEGRRMIYVPFRKAVEGVVLVEVRMERVLPEGAVAFAAPSFSVQGARSERGYLLLAAEKGVRLQIAEAGGLREVHTGSAPMRVAGAQHAFRFKEGGWSVGVSLDRTVSSVHAEAFHLVSVGEGMAYGSVVLTYHIEGAPIQNLRVRVPEAIPNIELTGADIEGWQRDGELCTVRLQTRIMGDYTLLATYDHPFAYEGDVISAGTIETVDTASEVGYIALASSSSIKLTELQRAADTTFGIDRDEIPAAYAAPVTDPILRSYKFTRRPHAAAIRVEPFETERLLGQVADYVEMATRISEDGEAVTRATYFIKNASRQYLVVTLPDGVELWSIKYVSEEGEKEDVLSQRSEGRILIPVRRPRDPNTAIRIELVYARSHSALGLWRSGLEGLVLTAPRLPQTHASFSRWQVAVPESCAIAAQRSNLVPQETAAVAGLAAVPGQAWLLAAAVLDGPGGRRLVQAFKSGWGGAHRRTYIRTVNLADGEAPELRLFVVPHWVGPAGNMFVMLAALALGLALTGVGLLVRSRPLVAALGCSLLAFGAARASAGRSVMAAGLVALAAYLVVRFVVLRGWRWLWRGTRRALRGGRRLAAWAGRASWAAAVRAARSVLAARERTRMRKHELRMAMSTGPDSMPPFEAFGGESESPAPPRPPSPGAPPGGAALCLLLALGLAACGGARAEDRPPVMESLTVEAWGPAFDREAERSARVRTLFTFEAGEALSFRIAPASMVLTGRDLGSRHARLASGPQGYALIVARPGRYSVELTWQVPVREQKGEWSLGLPLLPSMRNRARLVLPEKELEVQSPQAVLLRSRETEEGTEVEAVFGPATEAVFSWRPRVRRTRLEQAVLFCEVNTYALLQSGLVDLTHQVRYQIAQGEIRELSLSIPAGMSVTAVSAPGLASWRFDPERRILDAVLERPASGELVLTLVTQVASEGLPYRAELGVPIVREARRQRGAFAVAAPDTVQVRVAEVAALYPMNIEDFPATAVRTAAERGRHGEGQATVRRAFRYREAAQVRAAVETEKVLPEVRVVENGELSVANERILLTTRLELAVAKSGVFSAVLGIPADFDVENLSGPDVSHWDDSGEDGGTVTVHFKRRITEKTVINAVLARTEKGVEPRIDVPRVTVRDARKHRGRLTVAAERGIRLMVADHRGVDIQKASDAGIRRKGVLVFDLLRPTWSIALRADVMAPVVKSEVLQRVDLAEGILQCRAYVRYEVENAGVKRFLIQSPVPGINLSVSGGGVARVHETDRELGIWQVDLHSKVEQRFNMVVSYQIPYEAAQREVRVRPLRTPDTAGQRGYLAVIRAGRVQVRPSEGLEGLRIEDPRNIPADFGAGDLSNAILCYRAVRESYDLLLSVVRHESAQVLPASIDRVRLTSVVGAGRKLLTHMTLGVTVGDLRFLKFRLPHRDDDLWMALVDGSEVPVSRDGALRCIPLEQEQAGGAKTVEIVYAGSSLAGRTVRRHEYRVPTFEGLPLNDLSWQFYVAPGVRYYGFGGTMQKEDAAPGGATVFDAQHYTAWNARRREVTLKKARQVLDAGQNLARTGQQREAMRALQAALTYSQGQADLNEDARVQFRNLVKQQVKMGLVNRRGALRVSRNIQEKGPSAEMQGFRDGNFTQEYAERVEQSLSSKDRDALEVVADKMIDQQAAAAGVVTAISITMPKHGRVLSFSRALQIDPDGELSVVFNSANPLARRTVEAVWPAAVLFFLIWLPLARRRRVAARA